jgi:hypothetical protein
MRYIAPLVSILMIALCAKGQTVHLPEKYNRVKVENGLIVCWQVKSEDPQVKQIYVYDRDGKLVSSLDLLRLVREAKRSSVLDVSAHPNGLIVASTIYRKDDSSIPAAALLWFDFAGNPIKAVALAPSREAWRVTIDSESNVWTLTAGSGESKPSDVPMIVGYSSSGSVVKEVSKRSEFPIHAKEILEDERTGASGFGHTSRGLWLWLPGSNDQVTFKSDGSIMSRSTTGLPTQVLHPTAHRVALTDSGTLLAQVWGDGELEPKPQSAFFIHAQSSKEWIRYTAPCSQCNLIGIDSGSAFFIKWEKTGSDVYSASVPQ